jgi:hypothetical protein
MLMVRPFVSIIILLLAVGLIHAALSLVKWKRSRKRQRPPFKDKLLRSPGHRITIEIQDLSNDLSANIAMAITTPLLFYSMHLSLSEVGRASWLAGTLSWTVAIAVSLFFLRKIITLINRRRELRIGLAGEMAAGEELNRLMLDGYHVYHDFPADRFNIDHILVGPSGVFAVETKTRSKGSVRKASAEATVVYDGERLRFPNWETTEPIDQAKAQGKWLAKWLSGAVGDPVSVTPIVTIPGWFIEGKSPNGVPVLNPKQVKTYLDAKKEVLLSESMIKRICHQLEQKCRDVDLWDWY